MFKCFKMYVESLLTDIMSTSGCADVQFFFSCGPPSPLAASGVFLFFAPPTTGGVASVAGVVVLEPLSELARVSSYGFQLVPPASETFWSFSLLSPLSSSSTMMSSNDIFSRLSPSVTESRSTGMCNN